MRNDDMSIEGRLAAQETMIRALFGRRGPIERAAILSEVGAEASEAEAVARRSDDEGCVRRAAEIRAALERMTE